MPFIEDTTLERRKTISKKIISDNPNRIPIILMPKKRENTIYEWFLSFFVKIEKKVLKERRITSDITNSFSRILRPLITEGYTNFQFMNGEQVDMNQSLESVYNDKKNEDGFLYIRY